MRAFIAVVAVAALVGVITAQQQFAVNARTLSLGQRIDRLGAVAVRPINFFVPPAPPPVQPPQRNVTSADFASSTLTAISALVVDHRTDASLFSKNSQVARPLASITKLMTTLIVLERLPDLSVTTTVVAADVHEGNQTIGPGEIYSAQDLLTASLVGSLNTAVHALVRLTGLTDEQFVSVMNQRARDLGLTSMRFADPTGLSPENVANAQDVAQLLKFTLSHPDIKILTVRGNSSIKERKTKTIKKIKATDWFTSAVVPLKVATVEGGKTGYIPESGYNFAVQLKNPAGHEIRVVVLGADTAFSRFTESGALATWVYQNFTWAPRE